MNSISSTRVHLRAAFVLVASCALALALIPASAHARGTSATDPAGDVFTSATTRGYDETRLDLRRFQTAATSDFIVVQSKLTQIKGTARVSAGKVKETLNIFFINGGVDCYRAYAFLGGRVTLNKGCGEESRPVECPDLAKTRTQTLATIAIPKSCLTAGNYLWETAIAASSLYKPSGAVKRLGEDAARIDGVDGFSIAES